MRYFAIWTLLTILSLSLSAGLPAAAQDRLLTYEEISEKFRTMPKDEANAWFDSLSQAQQDVFEAEMRRRADQMEKDLEIAEIDGDALGAVLAIEEGRYRDAIAPLTKAIERGSDKGLDRALLFMYRGIANQKNGNPEQGLADLNEALRLGPNYAGSIYAARAPAYRDLRRYDEALADFNKAISRRPDDVENYVDRATLLFDQFGRNEEALRDLNFATTRQPGNAFAWWAKGKVLTALARYDQAVNTYSRTIDIKDDVSYVWMDRGRAYMALGQLEQALDDYSTSISLNGQEWLAYDERALVNFDLGNTDAAFADLERSIELAPQEARPVANRGVLFKLSGDPERAISDFNHAIALNPSYAGAYYERGTAYAQMEQIDEALQDFSKAIELNPQDAFAHFERGKAYATQGEIDYAFGNYSKAIELDPGHAEAYSKRGLIHVEDGAFDRAQADFTKAIESAPQFGEVYVYRALTHNELGDPDRALADLDRALEHIETWHSEKTERAFAHYLKGENDQALIHINSAFEMSSKYARAYRVRGNIYHHGLADPAEARASYTRALEFNPNEAQAHFGLSNLDLAKGDWEAAANRLKQIIAIAPWHHGAYNNLAYVQCCAPDPALRDGASALKNAQQAVAMEDYAAYFDTLGAAYAEIGEFDKAIENAEIARDAFRAAGDDELFKRVESHLELYRTGRPYHAAPGGT